MLFHEPGHRASFPRQRLAPARCLCGDRIQPILQRGSGPKDLPRPDQAEQDIVAFRYRLGEPHAAPLQDINRLSAGSLSKEVRRRFHLDGTCCDGDRRQCCAVKPLEELYLLENPHRFRQIRQLVAPADVRRCRQTAGKSNHRALGSPLPSLVVLCAVAQTEPHSNRYARCAGS